MSRFWDVTTHIMASFLLNSLVHCTNEERVILAENFWRLFWTEMEKWIKKDQVMIFHPTCLGIHQWLSINQNYEIMKMKCVLTWRTKLVQTPNIGNQKCNFPFMIEMIHHEGLNWFLSNMVHFCHRL